MNYGDSALRPQPLASETACKLDSKARLVLPLNIRSLLSVSYGDTVSIEIIGKNNDGLLLKLTHSNPAAGSFVKTSKNNWEKR